MRDIFRLERESPLWNATINLQNILHRMHWELGMILFTIVALLITPVFITFYFDQCEKWYLYNLLIDAVFICDIVICFFTGYYDPRTQLITMDPAFVMRYTRIAYKYNYCIHDSQ